MWMFHVVPTKYNPSLCFAGVPRPRGGPHDVGANPVRRRQRRHRRHSRGEEGGRNYRVTHHNGKHLLLTAPVAGWPLL